MNKLEELRHISRQLAVGPIADAILDDDRFSLWSGSAHSFNHHYGRGGLLEHTSEVVELCLQTNEYFFKKGKGVTPSLLFLAALFHDSGKMYDYAPVDPEMKDWTGTKHKRNIHHISRSALVWSDAFTKFGEQVYGPLDDREQIKDEILHAILSHHGLREWGSPVAPNSRLAWILHLCDGISARVDDVERRDILGRNPGGEK
jgi:3'-5' exoribonuclease